MSTHQTLATVLLGAFLVSNRPSRAQEPPAAPAIIVEPKGPLPPAKAGRFMVNVKLGAAFMIHPDNVVHTPYAAVVTEFGVAVTPDRNGYLILPLSIHAAPDRIPFIMIPIGFQYDVALPLPGLYITPRASLGYALTTGPQTLTSHFGVFIPEVGVKYVVKGRWNVGFDPLSLPFLFPFGGAAGLLHYRFLGYAGANF